MNAKRKAKIMRKSMKTVYSVGFIRKQQQFRQCFTNLDMWKVHFSVVICSTIDFKLTTVFQAKYSMLDSNLICHFKSNSWELKMICSAFQFNCIIWSIRSNQNDAFQFFLQTDKFSVYINFHFIMRFV